MQIYVFYRYFFKYKISLYYNETKYSYTSAFTMIMIIKEKINNLNRVLFLIYVFIIVLQQFRNTGTN
jgi:hypothetical protein